MFRFKLINKVFPFIELTRFFKFVFSEIPTLHFGKKPAFARKTSLQKHLWKSQCYKCTICNSSQCFSWAQQVMAVAIATTQLMYTNTFNQARKRGGETVSCPQ